MRKIRYSYFSKNSCFNLDDSATKCFNIDEALYYKNSRLLFQNAFLISSAKDNKTVVIENSINKVGYIKQTQTHGISHHFPSKELNNNKSIKKTY
jgi:hypothetical protein